MERHTGSNPSSARHAQDFGERHLQEACSECARGGARVPAGDLPRMFALVQEFDEDDGESLTEVVAYGLALPDGTAATVGANGHGFGRWTNPHRAAWRLRSDLVWLGECAAEEPAP